MATDVHTPIPTLGLFEIFYSHPYIEFFFEIFIYLFYYCLHKLFCLSSNTTCKDYEQIKHFIEYDNYSSVIERALVIANQLYQ